MLLVNGEEMAIEERLPLVDLLRRMKMEDRPCAVEVNRVLVPKGNHAQCVLQDGDTVEVVTLVGGG